MFSLQLRQAQISSKLFYESDVRGIVKRHCPITLSVGGYNHNPAWEIPRRGRRRIGISESAASNRFCWAMKLVSCAPQTSGWAPLVAKIVTVRSHSPFSVASCENQRRQDESLTLISFSCIVPQMPFCILPSRSKEPVKLKEVRSSKWLHEF